MNDYKIRNAIESDIPFLADAVIAGEKGITDKCNYSTLFNVPESKVRKHLISMFEEEIDGCEFSLSSYFVIEFEENPVASFGGWIEAFDGEMPSKILKSNLINYTFGAESMAYLKSKSDIVKELSVERTPQTLQFEYLYVSDAHRRKKLPTLLINKIEETALAKYPELKKSQFQLFNNNIRIVKLFEKHGYHVVKSIKATNIEVLNYLPSDEKLIMEKYF